tara:strand:- start:3604 stop:4083 length:480 start_codon:yes stop_codon:yes gene_type:complete
MGMVQLPQFRMSADEHIVPLRYEHISRLSLTDDSIEYIRHIPSYLDYIWDNSADGWSWAAIGKGKVIAVFGIRMIWTGLAEMWMVPGRDMGSHAISLVRGARAITDSALQDYGVRRLQITVKAENDTAFRFAKAMHFEVESVMTKFGPEGSDYYMMVRF